MQLEIEFREANRCPRAKPSHIASLYLKHRMFKENHLMPGKWGPREYFTRRRNIFTFVVEFSFWLRAWICTPNPKAASRLIIYLAVRRIPKTNATNQRKLLLWFTYDPREDRSPTIQRTKGRVQIYAIENITFMTVFHYVPIVQLHFAECIDDDNTHLGISNSWRAPSEKSVCTYFVADLQFARNPLADPFCVKKCQCFSHKRANKKQVGENPPSSPPPPPPPNTSSNSVKHTRTVFWLSRIEILRFLDMDSSC